MRWTIRAKGIGLGQIVVWMVRQSVVVLILCIYSVLLFLDHILSRVE